ncbi:uncharacterized protein J8A68_002351 [[Candida] subhashii]|uniref:Uncharacterized protein n=1 Tax=[Candida] subhashii TaxID=561895 RepID=A0A8J5UQD7_9ASCO|nr:uncharacterized protein J8A68_002351 [[Candida] subhashii]KAG7664097.1 hypothetical protein J8A68_002351 [[Candida] subhashii]
MSKQLVKLNDGVESIIAEFDSLMEETFDEIHEVTRKASFTLWNNIFNYTNKQPGGCQTYYYYQLKQFEETIYSSLNDQMILMKAYNKSNKVGVPLVLFDLCFTEQLYLMRKTLIAEYKMYVDILVIKLRLKKLLIDSRDE